MSRSDFGWWGAELDKGRFGCALAALGVLGTDEVTKGLMVWGGIDARLDCILSRYKQDPLASLRWSPSIDLASLSDQRHAPSASQLADAWDRLKKEIDKEREKGRRDEETPLRLELDVPESYRHIIPWIYKQLSLSEVGINGLYVLLPRTYEIPDWHWPLRLGCMDQTSDNPLFDRLAKIGNANLIDLRQLSAETPDCDILVMSCSPREALKLLLNLDYKPRASCVVFFGKPEGPWVYLRPLLDLVRTELRASGVCLAHPSTIYQRSDWIEYMIVMLSHNNPLDIAVFQKTNNGTPGFANLLFASRDLLVESRLKTRVLALARRMAEMPKSAPPIKVSATAGYLHKIMAVGAHTPHELAEPLREHAEKFKFEHESGEASGIAELELYLRKASVTAPPTPEQPRFIQAQIFMVQHGELRRICEAFVGGEKYAASVRIGPADQAWLTPLGDFPEHLLPPNEERYMLQVFFSEPNHLPEVQTATIVLPRRGPSTECRFVFSVRKDIPVFEGRIIVAHKNRVLQTALLKCDVVGDVTQAPNAQAVRLETEVVVRPTIIDLSGRQRFDLALLVNHTSDNRPRLTKLADDRASIRYKPEIEDSIRIIQDRLESIAHATADIAGTGTLKERKDIEDLLSLLALRGRMLYDAIIMDQDDADWLPRHPERIQLISARAEDYLPLEFLYDRPTPTKDAKLCPNAEQALGDKKKGEGGRGKLYEKCQNCPIQDDSDMSPYICPIGFWCLSRVIERHAHDAKYGAMVGTDGGYVMQAELIKNRAPLQILKTCLYAASDKVDEVVHDLRQQFLQTLNTASNNAAVMVSTWDDWAKEVADRHPTLLMLMPHTLNVLAGPAIGLPAMEIGASNSEPLISGRIPSEYIRISLEDQPPIVILLGCETLVPFREYIGFIPQFRRKGAALVLSTLTTVLGRHVVPIAQGLVEELKAEIEATDGHSVSFGDVLLKVRRKMLLQGLPIVLCLVAYGDADWRLAIGS